MLFNNSSNDKDKNPFHPKAPIMNKIGHYKSQCDYTLEGPKYSFEIEDIPLGPMTGKFKISDKNIRMGAGVGFAKTGYVGGVLDYDLESGQLGAGVEVKALEYLSAEGIARYNWEDDTLNFKASIEIFDQQVDLVNLELKDIAQNTIGKGIDDIRNGIDNFVQHVSPGEKAKKRFVEELKNDAQNVRDIHGLRDIINKMGENELAMKGNEAMFQLHKAELNYLGELDGRVSQNTADIQRHEIMLAKHEDRLNEHDIILANHGKRLDHHDRVLQVHSAMLSNHEKRLNQHERILSIHGAILSNHEKRLNTHERILNIHENRLNEHDRILAFHGSILRDHEEKLNAHASAINNLYNITNQHSQILNIHANKLNELDERMYNAENNIFILEKEVDIHSKILSNHDEILKMHSESIGELYDVTRDQQIQIKIHNDILNEHQIEIVKLIYNYNDLKKRIEYDEKIINDLGIEVSKVINFSVETRDIVDGLSYQTQIHKDLIVQNHNDIVNIYKELGNQADFIIAHGNYLKEIANEVYYQRNILQQHEEKIVELQKFVKNIAKDIKNIYGILNNFDERLSKAEKEIDNMKISMKLNDIRNKIENRVEKLVDKIGTFNDNQLVDFIKCMYIALGSGNYNLLKVEEIVKNILILKIY